MASLTDKINGINDAARDAMEEASQQYGIDALVFLADPKAGIAVMQEYRDRYYARLDEIVAEAVAATEAFGPVEHIGDEWVAANKP